MPEGSGLRFIPRRVEGLPAVTEVAVHSDRLELLSAGRWVSFRPEDIAAWPSPAFIWRLLARLGWRTCWLVVGERDRFSPPSERFFRFYTWPHLVIYMPDESPALDFGKDLFQRVQDIMSDGGFGTWELRSSVMLDAARDPSRGVFFHRNVSHVPNQSRPPRAHR